MPPTYCTRLPSLEVEHAPNGVTTQFSAFGDTIGKSISRLPRPSVVAQRSFPKIATEERHATDRPEKPQSCQSRMSILFNSIPRQSFGGNWQTEPICISVKPHVFIFPKPLQAINIQVITVFGRGFFGGHIIDS